MTSQKLNSEALYNTVSQVKSNAEMFQTTLTQLESIVNTTAAECDSPAIQAFVATYEGYKKHITAFIESLNQYANQVNNYAQDIDAITSAGVERFKSIL